MQINKIDNTYFKAVNTTKAEGLLFSRLNSPKRYTQFYNYVEQCKNKPYNIELAKGENNQLKAKVLNSYNEVILDIEEYMAHRKLNANPLTFLKNIIKLADASTEYNKPSFKFEEFEPELK
jgi:hypothetical protein